MFYRQSKTHCQEHMGTNHHLELQPKQVRIIFQDNKFIAHTHKVKVETRLPLQSKQFIQTLPDRDKLSLKIYATSCSTMSTACTCTRGYVI